MSWPGFRGRLQLCQNSAQIFSGELCEIYWGIFFSVEHLWTVASVKIIWNGNLSHAHYEAPYLFKFLK